ncbi:MAG TPA: LysM peptidoglycan-binding domain-containing protein [Tepidisphaeraceae bacterium]|jgi:nucleoid-associated protein YgaU
MNLMRKDVRLGLAIGGVLLAVLVVYLLVISGGSDKNDVTLARPDGTQTAVAPSHPSETPPPADRPVHHEEIAGNNTQSGGTTTPPPSGDHPAVASNTPGSNDPWSAALNTGRLPALLTETPRTGADSPDPSGASPLGAAGSPSQTAEANQPTHTGTGSLSPTLPIAANAPALVTGGPATRPVGSGGTIAADYPPVPETPKPSPQKARTHVVQQGETFATIALAAYGSSAYYPHLIRANPTIDPRKLRPGMTITIPPLDQVKPSEGSSPGSTSSPQAAAAGQSTRGSVSSPIDPRTEYRVESGDSLERISMKLYGKRDHTDKLYELNKSAIGSDPAKLKLGMILKLPEPPTATASASGR